MACPRCGAKKNHLPGCDAVGGSGGHRVGGPGKNTPEHRHKYMLTSTDEYDAKDGRTNYHYTIKHFECAAEGRCPRPKYDDVQRRKI